VYNLECSVIIFIISIIISIIITVFPLLYLSQPTSFHFCPFFLPMPLGGEGLFLLSRTNCCLFFITIAQKFLFVCLNTKNTKEEGLTDVVVNMKRTKNQ